jgi:hypothetical protein
MAGKNRTKRPAPESAFAQAARAAGLEPQPGKAAVESRYREAVVLTSGHKHTASIDTDAHFCKEEPNEPRWDYGLGLSTAAGEEFLLWMEPHPASSTGKVQKMLDKLNWLKDKLKTAPFAELLALERSARPHTRVVYRWLAATGDNRIPQTSKEARKLAQAGLSQPQRFVRLP